MRATLRRGLVLPPSGRADASEDIAVSRLAADLAYDTVWIGERGGRDAPARLAAVAAATSGVTLGLGATPLAGRARAHLEEVVTTLGLIAPSRVAVAVDLPTTLSAARRPAWQVMLEEVAPVVRAAGVPFAACVADVATAVRVASHVDRLVLRAAAPDLVAAVVDAVGRVDPSTVVEVWLDAAVGEDAVAGLAAVVAERLAVAGLPGHGPTAHAARSLGLLGLRGDLEGAYATGRVSDAGALVPAPLVTATCLAGASAAQSLDRYAAAGADRVCVVPHGDPASRHDVVRAMAGSRP